jgi:hypothetical protein
VGCDARWSRALRSAGRRWPARSAEPSSGRRHSLRVAGLRAALSLWDAALASSSSAPADASTVERAAALGTEGWEDLSRPELRERLRSVSWALTAESYAAAPRRLQLLAPRCRRERCSTLLRAASQALGAVLSCGASQALREPSPGSCTSRAAPQHPRAVGCSTEPPGASLGGSVLLWVGTKRDRSPAGPNPAAAASGF